MSLRLRLLLALAPLFIVGLVVADIGTYTALRSFLTSRVDQQLFDAHVSIEGLLMDREPGPPGPGPPAALAPGTYAELRAPDGSVLRSRSFGFGNQSSSARPELPSALHPGPPGSRTYLSVEGRGGVSRYRVFIDTTNDGSGDAVVVAAPLDDVDSILGQLVLLDAGITAAVVVLLVVASWFLVGRGLRPLGRMSRTASSIVATDDLSRRVEPATERSEVGRLGLALNAMLSRLEAAFGARAAGERRLRHFVSDASHELRTPLTSIRGYAELLRRNPAMERGDILLSVRRIEDEAERMGVLVDDLLLLARLDQGRPLDRRPVDLEALVVDAGADARAADRGRAVSTRVTAPLVVMGDEMRLRQALGNLVRNALVHTPAGTPIELALRPDDGRAVLEVVDHGPGIPADQTALIFQRFHRADPERSRDRGGSGLGLSIAAAVVAAHAGRIGVETTPGGGATFRIDLPAAPQGEPEPSAERPADSRPVPGPV